MNNGWIKLHRRLLDNPITKKPAWLSVWVTLLLLANHDEEHKFIWNGREHILKAGQFITGRKALSEQTGVPQSTIEDVLRFLELHENIRQQKTTKYRLITILNWDDYQKSDSKPTTERQQSDTFKKLRSKEVNTGAYAPPLLALKKTPMKKNRLGSYNEEKSYDSYETVIDMDGEEEKEPEVKKTTATVESKKTNYEKSQFKHQKILAWYYSQKGLWEKFESVGQVAGADYRNAPVAKRLAVAGWTSEQMFEARERMLKNENMKDEWTLETLERYLTK